MTNPATNGSDRNQPVAWIEPDELSGLRHGNFDFGTVKAEEGFYSTIPLYAPTEKTWVPCSDRYPTEADIGDGTTVWLWTPDLDELPFQQDFQKVPFLHEAQPNLHWTWTDLKRPSIPKV